MNETAIHRFRRCAFAALLVGTALLPLPTAADTAAYRVEGDAIPSPLAASAGDAARGRALIVAREAANCLLCHAVPDPAMPLSGDLGPSLAGAGTRFTASQLRLRVADIRRIDPQAVMPSYYRTEGLTLVAAPYRGRPILTAQEVEDIVTYLGTLR